MIIGVKYLESLYSHNAQVMDAAESSYSQQIADGPRPHILVVSSRDTNLFAKVREKSHVARATLLRDCFSVAPMCFSVSPWFFFF